MITQDRRLHHRGPSDFTISAYTVLAIAVVYVAVITWPVSLALVLVFLVWFVSRESSSPFARSIHEAALPVLIGVGAFWAVSLVVSVLSQVSDENRESLFEADQWLLELRRDVHALSGPNLTVLLLILALLLAILYFFPQSKVIGRVLRARKELARLHLCLLAFTSFTLFGCHKADNVARDDYQRELHKFETSLRGELTSARKLLATKMADDAVRQTLQRPIPESTKSRLIYLMKNVQGPAYRHVRHESEPPREMSPQEKLSWRVKHSLDSWSYESTPIKGSSIRKAFIDDLMKEAHGNPTQDSSSAEANLESVAQQLFGGVADSEADWHRQEELIDQERSGSEQSEQFYTEASKGITEAITSTFSAAVGVFSPQMAELAKDWMNELLDEAIIPSFEHKIEGNAESVLKWSRDNLAAGHVHDVPDQLRQEINSSPVVVSDFLFPSFLTKRPSTSSRAWENEGVPIEIANEIDHRKDIAEEELGGGLQTVEEGGNRNPDHPFDFGRPLSPEEIERRKEEGEGRERPEERMRERQRGQEFP